MVTNPFSLKTKEQKAQEKTRRAFKPIAAEAALKAATNIENKTYGQLEEAQKETLELRKANSLALKLQDVPKARKDAILHKWLAAVTDQAKAAGGHDEALETLQAATAELRKFQSKTISKQIESFARSMRSPRSPKIPSSERGE